MTPEPEIYILDWLPAHEDHYGKPPDADTVYQWLVTYGFVVEGRPKVFANGQVQVTCYPDPRGMWESFDPEPPAPDTQLRLAVERVVKNRATLRAKPQRSPMEEDILSIMDLLVKGFGILD